MPKLDRDKVLREFNEAVNMRAAEIEQWLETADSKRVGWKQPGAGEDGESVGHASGRRIVAILGKKPAALTEDDFAHMRKVVGYVRRHLAQRPDNIFTSRWRWSLMNWGHDPTK
jgi:hypothetical protein